MAYWLSSQAPGVQGYALGLTGCVSATEPATELYDTTDEIYDPVAGSL